MNFLKDVDLLGKALADMAIAESQVLRLKKKLAKRLRGSGSLDLEGRLFHARVCRFKCKRQDLQRVNAYLKRNGVYDRFMKPPRVEERVIVNSKKRAARR